MLRQLDKAAVKQLLRNPDNKVYRNQMMNIGWWVAILTLVTAWLILVLSDLDDLKTVLVILIVNGGWCVPYVLACRRYAIVLTKEGMYISHVSTEDFRGPLSRRNLLNKYRTIYDSISLNKIGERMLSKEDKYTIFCNSHERFIKVSQKDKGYIYHFQKGESRTWQYLFASPGHTFDVDADASDWESLECSK